MSACRLCGAEVVIKHVGLIGHPSWACSGCSLLYAKEPPPLGLKARPDVAEPSVEARLFYTEEHLGEVERDLREHTEKP